MTDTADTETLFTDDVIDDFSSGDIPLERQKSSPISSRRRLEDKLAQLSLEKDVREFDFDL